MIDNIERIGNFTSSEISALMTKGKQAEGFGVPAITYIAEKRMERLLGQSIDNETNARPLTWGKVVEKRVFDLLGLDYTYSPTETDMHPTINYWSGSKDGMHMSEEPAVFDAKCPMTLKSFCQLVIPLYCGLDGNEAMDAIRNGFTHEGVTYEKHKQGEDYYWQLVSNAILNNVDYAELIVYMPYKSEIDLIKALAEDNNNASWIFFALEEELPYLNDGGVFQNLNIIRFKIPQCDKDALTANVEKAGSLLLGSTIIVSGDTINGNEVLIVEQSK